MMNPIVSLIIATYNAEKTLPECLFAFEQQKTEDIEIIVVDGKSTDGTLGIIKNSAIIDLYVSEKDNGIYDAWNKGIKMAHGDWIMFVGSDDEILPNVLCDYVKFAKTVSKDVDIITAKSRFVDLDGKLIKEIGRPYSWEEYRHNMEIAHGTTLHNRRLFNEIGLYDINFRICADYELLMRKGANIKSVFYNDNLMNFVVGGASFSYKCQLETYMIRRKYKSVNQLRNICLFLKRCAGITLNRIIYKTHE